MGADSVGPGREGKDGRGQGLKGAGVGARLPRRGQPGSALNGPPSHRHEPLLRTAVANHPTPTHTHTSTTDPGALASIGRLAHAAAAGSFLAASWDALFSSTEALAPRRRRDLCPRLPACDAGFPSRCQPVMPFATLLLLLLLLLIDRSIALVQ